MQPTIPRAIRISGTSSEAIIPSNSDYIVLKAEMEEVSRPHWISIAAVARTLLLTSQAVDVKLLVDSPGRVSELPLTGETACLARLPGFAAASLAAILFS
jgi:hypothetical protein